MSYLLPESRAGKNAGAISVIPECFRAVEDVDISQESDSDNNAGHAGAQLTVYKNLHEHLFTEEEKLFMCQQLRSTNDGNAFALLLDPTAISVAGKPRISATDIADRYNVSRNLLRKWLGKFDKGQKLYARAGQPSVFDSEFILSLRTELISAEVNGDSPNPPATPTVTQAMINKLHRDKLNRDGRIQLGGFICKKRKIKDVLSTGETVTSVVKHLIPVTHVILSGKTIARVKAEAEVKDRRGQALDSARVGALMDIRVVYKVACAWLGFAGYNIKELKWNFDCTAIIIRLFNTNLMRCVVRPRGQVDSKVEALKCECGLPLVIKVPTLGSASGELGRLHAIIAVPTMADGVFFKASVDGFVVASGPNSRSGVLYLCKSRAGNAALWRDIFLTFIIPTIASAAEHFKDQAVHADGSPMEPFLHSDGESIIMREAFSEDVMAALDGANINYLKGGPSHTSKTQDLDCGHLFDSLKAGLHAIENDPTAVVTDAAIRKSLEEAFKLFHTQFHLDLGSEMKKKIIYGLECVVYSTQRHWTAHKMKQSSVVVGLHVENENVEAGGAVRQETVDYDTVMTRTLNYSATLEELLHMRHCRHEVAQKFVSDGECLNTFLDSLNIASTVGATNRDSLEALARRDATLVTHSSSRRRFQEREDRKAAAAQAAEERREAEVQRLADQEASDLVDADALVLAFVLDAEDETCADIDASWKSVTLDKMKSFYRIYVTKEQRPAKQPGKKEDWIAFLAPILLSGYEAGLGLVLGGGGAAGEGAAGEGAAGEGEAAVPLPPAVAAPPPPPLLVAQQASIPIHEE